MRIRTPFRLLMMMALMGIAACTNEGEEQLLQGNEIKLVSEIIPLSRVAGQGLQSTQIAEGQPLGITIAGSQNGQANAEWVAGKNGSLTPKGEKVLWGDTDITITAYHPYNAGWKDGVQSFTVKTDQSTEDGYLNSDLLWATATASPTDLPVNLKFMHKLAKISVTLTSDDFDDLSGAEVSICGTGVSGDFNTATGEFLGVNGAVLHRSNCTANIILPKHITRTEKLKSERFCLLLIRINPEWRSVSEMISTNRFSHHMNQQFISVPLLYRWQINKKGGELLCKNIRNFAKILKNKLFFMEIVMDFIPASCGI